METHPVPQNISSYEFRLVGDMTLKQFLQLAGGIVLAVIIFRTPLIGILKYPLVFLSTMLGIALAFIPINNRPFSAWFSAFIKAIYAPTEYVWSPKPVIKPLPQAISHEPTASSPAPNPSPLPAVAPAQADITNSAPTTTTFSQITQVPPKTPPVVPVTPPTTNNLQPTTQNLPPTTNNLQPATVFPNLPPNAPVKSTPAAPMAPPSPAMPSPTIPNIVAGLVTDSQNQPLSSVTVEIVDTSTSLPIRALRTNKLGQFQIAIPLPEGQYNLLVDNDKYSFAPVSVKAEGKIIPPIVISGNLKTL